MQRFKSPGSAQKFLSTHAAVYGIGPEIAAVLWSEGLYRLDQIKAVEIERDALLISATKPEGMNADLTRAPPAMRG